LATRQCRATSSTGSSGCGWIGDDGGSGELRSQRVGGSRTMAADPRRGWTEDGGGGSGELWIPDVGGSRMMAAADPKRGWTEDGGREDQDGRFGRQGITSTSEPAMAAPSLACAGSPADDIL
jgi:hypothetical protein